MRSCKNCISFERCLELGEVVVNVRGGDHICQHFKDRERFVEQAQGFWKKEVEDGMYWYACSECGHVVPKDRYRQDWFSDYCPNCGARMDEEA